tara:strand:- start:1199 stop:1978 length:780 start_codon:yes stop_codon:yes gene_type:complete
MQVPLAKPVPHDVRIRLYRRNLLRRACVIVPLAVVGLAAFHAALLFLLGWTDRGIPTQLNRAVYVERDGSGDLRVIDPIPDPFPNESPLDDDRLDFSKTIVVLRYEARAQVPRLTPDRIDAYRAVFTLRTEPPLQALLVDGPDGPRRLEADEIATLETGIVTLLSELWMPAIRFNRRVPLAFGTVATRSGVPPDPAGSARSGLWGLLALPILLVGATLRLRAGERRVRAGRCAWCGHPISNGLCPECGTTFPTPHTATM